MSTLIEEKHRAVVHPLRRIIGHFGRFATWRSFWSRFSEWQARNLLAACLLALLELPHVIYFFPAATSDAIGFAWYVTQLICVFMLVGIPFAALSALFERRISDEIDRLRPADLVTVTIGAALGVALSELLHSFVGSGQSRQFPERIDLLRRFSHFVGIAVLTILCLGIVRRASAFVLAYTPNLGKPRVAVAFTAILLVVAGVLAADFALFSIHLDMLSAVIAVGGLCVMALGIFCLLGTPGVSLGRASLVVSVLLILIQPIGPWQNPHARFVLYNHSPLARSIMLSFGKAADVDGDETFSRWLGGTDCDDGDPKRNPTRRDAPGDGRDQDCSGNDSPGKSQKVSIVSLLEGCKAVPKKPSILLISMEALRAQAVHPSVMPYLSQFAGMSTRFNRAYTAATYTVFSTLSLFTGTPITSLTNANPLDNNRYCASERFTKTLKDMGYKTGFFCHVAVPKAIHTGFDDTNHYPEPLDPSENELFGGESVLMSAHLTHTAIEYIEDRANRPYFLWMHYTDTHAPYNGPSNLSSGNARLTPYEKTAAYVDYHIGRLLDFLVQSGRMAHTVVIITADHGEDLGERGKEGHGPFVFEESIHVPLYISIPSCPDRDVDIPVSLTQLGPTITTLGGAPLTGLPLFLSSTPSLPVVAEGLSRSRADKRLLRAFIEKRYKLIVDVPNGGRMLFDLREDPLERRDIYRVRRDISKRLWQHYQDWLDRAGLGWRPGCTPGWDADGSIPIVFGDAETAPVTAPLTKK